MTTTSAATTPVDVSIAAGVRDVLLGAAVVASIVAAGVFAYVCARRLGYPYELEWIEGGTLQHVDRVLHGEPLYTRPSLAWTPNIYPPLYYWVAAGLARGTGLSLLTLRVLSLASTLALAGELWVTVRKETRDLLGPTIAVGFFFASYGIGGSWFDIGRVDMLFLALLFGGLSLARHTTRPPLAAVTACVLVLAVLTKQAALVPALAVAPWMWTRGHACFATFAGTFVLASALAVAWLHAASNGWFTYYIWTLPSQHEIEHSAVVGFWTRDLLGTVAPALAVAALGLALLSRASSTALWLYAPFFAGLLATSYVSRLHTGGWDNVLLPVYAGTALLAGIGIGLARAHLPAAAVACVGALTVAQFALLGYRPTPLLPRAGAISGGDHVVAQLRALPGPVLLTGEPWLLDRAGRPDDMTAQASALQDVLRADNGATTRRLAAELDTAIREHRYCTVVVTDPAVFSALPPSFERAYRFDRNLAGARAIVPPTGYRIAPATIWVPAGPPTCG